VVISAALIILFLTYLPSFYVTFKTKTYFLKYCFSVKDQMITMLAYHKL